MHDLYVVFFFKAIIDYFEGSGEAGTDRKRRTERLEACLTIDRLQKAISDNYGMDIKRSTLYTRLLPRNSSTAEGKRHHDCAPVKMLRPENDSKSSHPDGHFATGTIKQMKVQKAVSDL